MPGFRWKLGSYVGGSYAVHESYKPYLVMKFEDKTDAWVTGEFSVGARNTADITISTGFRPTVLFLISYRPQQANGGSDSAFGARGGGFTFGAAGHELVGPRWDDSVTYGAGDVVKWDGKRYIANDTSLNDEPPSSNWDYLPIFEFTGSSRIRHAFEPKYSYWNEDCCFRVVHDFGATEVLKLNAEFTDSGFVLHVPVNLYDQTGTIAYLAMSGDFAIGAMTTGETNLPYDGSAEGAVFLSTKHAPGETFRTGKWDHMTGFASRSGNQAAIWGGGRNDNWDWTTERWEDDRAIVLADAASSSSFVGVNYRVGGRVIDWDSGISLDWPVFDNSQFRVGYVIAGNAGVKGILADMDVLVTNYETRPDGSAVDFPGGVNFEETAIRPDVVLMAGTNYTFSRSDTDPMNNPRSPGTWWSGGSGGFGWHASPYLDAGNDAFGVHTYGNAVAELGRYANSGTQYLRGYILAGQGANSNPPAFHQHSVNIIPNPLLVGTNWRYADRHAQMSMTRGLINPNDTPGV